MSHQSVKPALMDFVMVQFMFFLVSIFGGQHVKFSLKRLGKVMRRCKPTFEGDLRNCEVAFFEQQRGLG